MAVAETKKAVTLVSIEELKQKFGISDAVMEGVKAANGWKSGRQVEETVFLRACEDFRKAPAGGSRKKEEK